MNSSALNLTELLKSKGIDGPAGILVVLAIIGLSLAFLWWFFLPAVFGWIKLVKIGTSLKEFSVRPTPNDLEKVFSSDERLKEQWAQYSESLHQQHQEKNGMMQADAWRATLPAEVFFNPQNIVDGRLNVEFFKHLPGILTGIGIIGTFAGLIHGLEGFNVSGSDPDQVKKSLDGLMNSVKHAFWVSAGAILAAMVITVLEKFLLSRLYSRVEWIAGAVDKFFEGGAGEEYLSRLVRASEDSASQSKILKDALVKDLGDLLKNLTSTQLNASNKFNQELINQIRESAEQQKKSAKDNADIMSSAIAGSIRQSLEGPLQHIAQAVQSSTRDQSSSAAQMLGDVMAGFSERLNSLFGEQISGINELNRQTAQGMQGAADALNALVTRLEESSLRSANDMATHTTHAIQTMSEGLTHVQDRVLENNRAREEAMNERTHALVNGMAERVEVAMHEVSATTSGSLGNLVTSIEQASQRSANDLTVRMTAFIDLMENRQRDISAQTQGFVEQIHYLTGNSQDQTQKKIRETMDVLGQNVNGLVAALENSQARVLKNNQAREEKMTQRAQDMVNVLAEQVGVAVNQLSTATTGSLAALGQETSGLLNTLRDAQSDAFEKQGAREKSMVARVETLVSEMARMVDKVVKASNDVTQKMAYGVTELTSVSTTAIQGMNSGAERINVAVNKFADAGRSVAGVMTQTTVVAKSMDIASQSLLNGAKSLSAELQDHQSRRNEVAQLQREVCAIAESARREVGMTADVLQRIEGSVSKIKNAQVELAEYLDGVNDVLKNSNDAFADAVTNAIGRVNNKFHEDLVRSVNLLSGGIEHLEQVLNDLPTIGGSKI
jgi:hypothetical protein